MKRQGFTLIETIVSIAILVIMAGVLIPVLREGVDSYLFIRDREERFSQGRIAMRRMVWEIKRDCATITAIGASDFSFTNTSGDTVRYYYELNCIKRQLNGLPSAGAKLIEHVEPPAGTGQERLFIYYNNNLYPAEATGPTDVATIQIRFSVKDATGRNITLVSRAHPRNLP